MTQKTINKVVLLDGKYLAFDSEGMVTSHSTLLDAIVTVYVEPIDISESGIVLKYKE